MNTLPTNGLGIHSQGYPLAQVNYNNLGHEFYLAFNPMLYILLVLSRYILILNYQLL